MSVRIGGMAVFAAVAAIVSGATPSAAAPRSEQPAIVTGMDEMSAAKRHRRYARPYVPYVYRAPVYAAPRYGGSSDPSLMADGRPYPRPYDPGGCIIDEGYGRFTTCSNR